MTTQEKRDELNNIAREINNFQDLDIARNCNRAVPGEGDPDSLVMFIGEAPGYNEDLQGRPFVGQAGKLLEKTLKDVLGLERANVYITNIVKYRPPNNRDPLPDEIEACRDWLDRQIAVINPKIIATLGRYSMAKFIPDASISRIHGQARFVELKIKNCKLKIIVFPMYHPAAALRSGSVLNEYIQDFKKLKLLMGDQNPDLPQTTPEPSKVAQTSLF
jgi:uracil-DNA glycosylase family 4